MHLASPSEIFLLSPHQGAVPAYRELKDRLQPIVGSLPITVLGGPASLHRPRLPGAALISGGQPTALKVLTGVAGGYAGWRWVHLTSSGADSVAEWPPIPGDPLITFSRGVNRRAMAEWAIAAILHFYRDFGQYLTDAPKWERRWARELSGRRILVVGAGEAGSELGKVAQALGMEVVGVSRSGRPRPGFDQVHDTVALDRLLPTADVTVILLPRTPETVASFGASRIQVMKTGSLLLIMSRGGIVDEDAVLRAVRERHLAGAAFDVFAEEPLPASAPLWNEPGILVTPHVAGTTDRFMEHTAGILKEIWAAFQGEADPASIDRYRYRTTG